MRSRGASVSDHSHGHRGNRRPTLRRRHLPTSRPCRIPYRLRRTASPPRPASSASPGTAAFGRTRWLRFASGWGFAANTSRNVSLVIYLPTRSRRVRSDTSSPSPSCRSPRISTTSSSRAHRSTRHWCAILPAVPSLPNSALQPMGKPAMQSAIIRR